MKAFYVFKPGYGHYCGPTENGSYKMIEEWIDVDNNMWSEPYHLYDSKTYDWETK